MRKKSLNSLALFVKRKILFIILLLIFVPLFNGISCAAPGDLDLAEEYAPIYYFEGDETCFPVDVSYLIDNSYLYEFTDDELILIDDTPSVDELALYSTQAYQDYYLDNQKGSVDDEGVIKDYHSKMNSLGYTVYSNVFSEGGTTVIQYWMCYVFNLGELNQHEGDWEMVQIALSGGTPTEVMYSQHHSGQRATWDQVEKSGNHIKIFVARGSHANYLRAYSGKFGLASDFVGDNGKILEPKDYELELLESQSWLLYAGRWGEFTSIESEVRGKAGPPGPMYREDGNMWEGIAWGNSLPQANGNIFLFEWFLYNFVIIFILLTVVSFCLLGFLIYRRHKKYGLGPRILSLFYIDGFNLKSIGNILCIVGIVIAIIALFNTWYAVSVDISAEGFETQGMMDMITIDGIDGIKINLLEPSKGPVQLGSFSLPFSLLIGIGLVFLIIGTIGISTSGKLGRKYVFRGIKLIIPVLIIIIVIWSLSLIPFGSIAGFTEGDDVISEVFGAFSSSPVGGQQAIPVSVDGESGQIDLQWGLGLGGQLLIFAGIILLIAGILETTAKTTFFEPKVVEKSVKAKAETPKKPVEKSEPKPPKAEEQAKGQKKE